MNDSMNIISYFMDQRGGEMSDNENGKRLGI